MADKNRKAFTIRLEGDVLDIFYETKRKTGLVNDAEVIRYIIMGFDRLRKTK